MERQLFERLERLENMAKAIISETDFIKKELAKDSKPKKSRKETKTPRLALLMQRVILDNQRKLNS